jgi:1-acyl-sn-glycerol-3-phosphate acyltransferase
MEAVLMVIYPPWQVEMLGSVDVPHERITQITAGLYKFIPVNRGHVDRAALVKSLDVLRQGGVLAIFPEGGIWDAGHMRAHTGVAWLSYRANAPVLPIAFSGTMGALGAAMKLKRPRLTMRVGQLIPPARLPEGESRKAYSEAFATDVVRAIRALLPDEDPTRRPRVIDERFQLRAALHAEDGSPQTYPSDLAIQHATALAKLLHRPAILKIFTSNLNLPTQPLQNLEHEHDPERIAKAVQAILNYLDEDNPYLLTYRFGPQEAEAMRLGLEELLALARWASKSGLRLTLTPIRRYTLPDREGEVVQVKQGTFERWM